jgi:cell wall assembly regulator SMI1
MKFKKYLDDVMRIYEDMEMTLQISSPASPGDLAALSEKCGFTLPAELQAAWQKTDGLGEDTTFFARPEYLTGYDFLSIDGALKARTAMEKRAARYADYVEPEPRDQRISSGWFKSGWLPFGSFGGGSLLLIVDFSPSAKGKPGQIICFTHDPDQIEYVAASFEDFLGASLKTLAEDPEEFFFT